jgi:hypothetical protein
MLLTRWPLRKPLPLRRGTSSMLGIFWIWLWAWKKFVWSTGAALLYAGRDFHELVILLLSASCMLINHSQPFYLGAGTGNAIRDPFLYYRNWVIGDDHQRRREIKYEWMSSPLMTCVSCLFFCFKSVFKKNYFFLIFLILN